MLGSTCNRPSREKIQKNMPTCFKSMYPDCRGIIDASEIKVQAPSSLVLNSEMYLSHTSHTTYKGNVVISPSGKIILISSLLEGSISDKELVRISGLLPLLQSGDQIMANKGFVIQDLLTPLGCSVVMPSFLSSKQQFSKDEKGEKFITFKSVLKGQLGGSRNFTSLIGSSHLLWQAVSTRYGQCHV